MKTNFKFVGLMLLLVLAIVPAINAQSYLEITNLEVNDVEASDLVVSRGEELEVTFLVKSLTGDLNDVYAEGALSGFRQAYYVRDEVTDFSKSFNLLDGDSKKITMNFKVPMDMEMKEVKLRIVVYDENSDSIITKNYQLSVYGAEDEEAIEIRDFFISPSDTIEAGRALSFKVKVKNHGDYDIDDLKVKVAIPELNIQTYETIDTIESGETQSFEALLLRIPSDAEKGDYEVVATVEFDRYNEVETSQMITVTEAKGTPCSGTSCSSGSDSGSSQTVVTMPASVDVIKGTQGSVYPILVENKGSAPKTYVLSVSGVSGWGTAVFEPSSVFVLKAGQSQTVYLRVAAAKDAEAGDKVMKVTITAGDEMKDTTVIASVKEGTGTSKTSTGSNMNLKTVLEWFVVILVILLVIFGLILIIKNIRKGNDKEEEQSYY